MAGASQLSFRRCVWRSVRSASVVRRHSMSCENEGARRFELVNRFSQSEGIGASIKVITLRGGYRPALPAVGVGPCGRPICAPRSTRDEYQWGAISAILNLPLRSPATGRPQGSSLHRPQVGAVIAFPDGPISLFTMARSLQAGRSERLAIAAVSTN